LSDVEVSAPFGANAGGFDLVISARSKDGREIATARTSLVVALAQAPAPSSAIPLDEATQARHMTKARELLDMGQVAAARLLLQRAADAGNSEAALILGDTYDPVKLFQLGARGIVGDMAKATFWYERADELGSPEAKARIVGLGGK
jgi:TPR repeat protein